MSEITRADYQATVREREALRARIAELVKENGRLKAPETEDEWDRHAVSGRNLVRGIDRISFRAILAARAKEQS